MRLVESSLAVVEDGKIPKYIRRSFFERLTKRVNRRWCPLKKYKLIMAPYYKPIAYILNNQILVYHPSLKEDIRKQLGVEK